MPWLKRRGCPSCIQCGPTLSAVSARMLQESALPTSYRMSYARAAAIRGLGLPAVHRGLQPEVP